MIVELLLPSNTISNKQQLTKAKILIYLLTALGAISMSIIISKIFFDINTQFPSVPLTITITVLLVLFKYTGSFILIGNIFVAIFWGVIFKMSLETGGVFSMDYFSVFMIPILAFVLGGYYSGIAWFIVMIFYYLYIWNLADSPIAIEQFRAQTLTFGRNYYLVGSLTLSTFVFAIFAIFYIQKNKLIKQLAKTQAELEKSNQELERYAHTVSHDLKQPLRTMGAFGVLLQRHLNESQCLDKKSNDYLEFIISGTNRMNRLVKDLLEYATLKATKEAVFKTADLNYVLEDVLANLKNQIDTNEVSIQSEALPTIAVIPIKVNQLFQNLISNSIKFRKKEEPLVIQISSKEQGGYYQFSIADNGIGIAEENLSKIFEPFKKLHSSKDYHGSGIGLATCQYIAALHKGKIWAESTEGKGTTFFFKLKKGIEES